MDVILMLKAIILGIVEGITEWLPISSTGHMILVDEFIQLNVSAQFKEMFFVVIQLGAIFAVVVLFWDRLFPIEITPKFYVKKEIMILWSKIVIACLPAAVVGLLFDDWLDANFYNSKTVAFTLILYGIFFIIVEKNRSHKKAAIHTLESVTIQKGFMIGLFQMLALIPGTSRSGATILGAMLLGTSRTVAAEFSFFLSIPVMFGASAIKLLKFGLVYTTTEVAVLIVGMVTAFVVSIIAIKFLLKYIQQNTFVVFGWYRIILGLIIMIYFFFK